MFSVCSKINERTLRKSGREFEGAYGFHHDIVPESKLSSKSRNGSSAPSAPQYDSEAGDMHPVLRAYSEPDVLISDEESSHEAVSVHETVVKRRRLTR